MRSERGFGVVINPFSSAGGGTHILIVFNHGTKRTKRTNQRLRELIMELRETVYDKLPDVQGRRRSRFFTFVS